MSKKPSPATRSPRRTTSPSSRSRTARRRPSAPRRPASTSPRPSPSSRSSSHAWPLAASSRCSRCTRSSRPHSCARSSLTPTSSCARLLAAPEVSRRTPRSRSGLPACALVLGRRRSPARACLARGSAPLVALRPRTTIPLRDRNLLRLRQRPHPLREHRRELLVRVPPLRIPSLLAFRRPLVIVRLLDHLALVARPARARLARVRQRIVLGHRALLTGVRHLRQAPHLLRAEPARRALPLLACERDPLLELVGALRAALAHEARVLGQELEELALPHERVVLVPEAWGERVARVVAQERHLLLGHPGEGHLVARKDRKNGIRRE